MRWTKAAALDELGKLTDNIAALHGARRHDAEHTYWRERTLSLLEDVFGRESRYFLSFANLTWRRGGTFVVDPYARDHGDVQAALDREHHNAYLSQLETAKGLLVAARGDLSRKELDEVYRGRDTGPEASLILKIINLAEHKLRKVVREVPGREKDIQDAFENLLLGADIPYSREKDRIEYSSKTYVPDFCVQRAELAVEIKLCSKDGREGEIIAEINDDILAYKMKYGNLMFVVYDVGFIRDIERFTSTFEECDGVVVRVVKH